MRHRHDSAPSRVKQTSAQGKTISGIVSVRHRSPGPANRHPESEQQREPHRQRRTTLGRGVPPPPPGHLGRLAYSASVKEAIVMVPVSCAPVFRSSPCIPSSLSSSSVSRRSLPRAPARAQPARQALLQTSPAPQRRSHPQQGPLGKPRRGRLAQPRRGRLAQPRRRSLAVRPQQWSGLRP